jgi:hypothetical protein
MRACHLRDGAAESEFLAWLEDELANPKGTFLLSLSLSLSLSLLIRFRVRVRDGVRLKRMGVMKWVRVEVRVRDGAAETDFLAWLEDELANPKCKG